MLLRLQRYTFTLVYKPGSEMVLADTLSRAYPPADTERKTVGTEFTEELAELIDEEQMQELRLVASQRTIDSIRTAAAEDDEYIRLKERTDRCRLARLVCGRARGASAVCDFR